MDFEGARETYLQLLGRAAERFDVRVVAYCLMSTHLHLVLLLGTDRLGSFCRAVHAPFGNWLRMRRNSHICALSERPLSVVVDGLVHGWEVVRYVHNNPVRAGVVERAVDSVWTSHRAFLGLDEVPPWLALEVVLGQTGGVREKVAQKFAEFVDEGRFEPRRPEMRRGFARAVPFRVFGSEAFAVETALSREAQRVPGGRPQVNVDALREALFIAMEIEPTLTLRRYGSRRVSRARSLVAWAWIEKLHGPQVEVARALGVKPSAICKMMNKLRIDGVTVREALLIDDVLKAISGRKEMAGGTGE